MRRSGVAAEKSPPADAGHTRVRCLGGEDPLVNGVATHSSILAWRIPWTTVHEVKESVTQTQSPKEPKAGSSVLLLFVVVAGSRRSPGAEP